MKNALINTLLVLTSIAVVCVILEVGLRLTGYATHAVNTTRLGRETVGDPLPGIRYLFDSYASYAQAWPDDPRGYFSTDDHSILYRVNNYGFRGDDLDVSRNHRVRIAVIGDSFCWGTGVKVEDRFTSLIEERLSQNKVLGQEYEVYNFCMQGFNTANEVALYEQVIQHFQPDLLLISYFLNDVNLPPDRYFQWRAWEPASLKEWRECFRLVDWVVNRISGKRARSVFVSSVNAAYERGHPGYESVVDGFEQLAHLNRQQGIPTVLAIFPWLADLDQASYPFHEAHKAIRQAGEQQGFEVLDLFEVFAGHTAKELWVHPIDQHPNEVGHGIAANAMYAWLVDVMERSGDDLLDGVARRRGTPIPTALRAPPGKEWYKAFAALALRENND